MRGFRLGGCCAIIATLAVHGVRAQDVDRARGFVTHEGLGEPEPGAPGPRPPTPPEVR